MYDLIKLITDIQSPFNMIVIIVLICTFAGIITSIAKEIRKFACHRSEVDFKRELLDRGMSVDEVERIVRAKNDPSK